MTGVMPKLKKTERKKRWGTRRAARPEGLVHFGPLPVRKVVVSEG